MRFFAALLLVPPLLAATPAVAGDASAPVTAPVDAAAPAEALAAYLRIDTSIPPGMPTDATAAYIPFLVERYAKPLGLEAEVLWNRTLLLRWRAGAERGRPLVFLGHADVVPVAENERAEWTQPPFAGAVTGGYVWGRGALDMKGATIAQLEAIAALQRAGVRPGRDVFVLVNPDEEVGGQAGAGRVIAERLDVLESPYAVIDEGAYVLSDVVPGAKVAAVAVGEKGYLTVRLRVETEAGHASMPSPDDAPSVLTRALARLDAVEFPGVLLPPTQRFLERMAAHSAFPQSFILRHPGLFAPLITSNFEKKPATNAVIRTTHALTIVRAGVKDNVIPRTAEAYVNFRLLPGDKKDDVLQVVRDVVADERVAVEVVEFWGETPLSPIDGPVWTKLEAAVAAALPDAFVAPVISPGTQDARYFAQAGIPTYRFVPFTLDAAERKSIHGVNERVSVENLAQAVRVYQAIIQGVATADP